MSLKVIFFDIDGTLLSTGGAGQRAMELALTEDFEISFPFEGVLAAGRTDRGITDEIFARYSIENNEANRQRFRDAYLKQLPQAMNAGAGLLLPSVRELLQALAEVDGITLSLLTGNYADGAWMKLKHFELDQFFTSGGFGDHHANRDDVARLAISEIGNVQQRTISGEDTMVIGDTPADIRCARAIGSKAVAVATGIYSADELKQHEPDHLFGSFADVDNTLQQILKLL